MYLGLKTQEDNRLEKVRHQRSLCLEIIGAYLHHGFNISPVMHRTVILISKRMEPANDTDMAILETLHEKARAHCSKKA